jgi:hypothetical protein
MCAWDKYDNAAPRGRCRAGSHEGDQQAQLVAAQATIDHMDPGAASGSVGYRTMANLGSQQLRLQVSATVAAAQQLRQRQRCRWRQPLYFTPTMYCLCRSLTGAGRRMRSSSRACSAKCR